MSDGVAVAREVVSGHTICKGVGCGVFDACFVDSGVGSSNELFDRAHNGDSMSSPERGETFLGCRAVERSTLKTLVCNPVVVQASIIIINCLCV